MGYFNDRQQQYEDWQRYGKERGFFDRVSDEVKSWFGDENAEHRRQLDQRSPGGDWFNREDEVPEWQRKDYSGSSPRGSQFDPQGRYDEQEGKMRGWGQPRSRQRWGAASERHSGNLANQPSGRPGYRSERSSYDELGRMSPQREEHGNASYYRPQLENDVDEYTSSRPKFFESPQYQKNYKGLGPRNFQRSDERILDEIHHELTMHPAIDATDIDVLVEQGVVTLKGAVDSRSSKRLAEDICEDVFGVKEVNSQLRVNRGDFSSMGQNSEEQLNRGGRLGYR